MNIKTILTAAALVFGLSAASFAQSTTISLKATPSGGKPFYQLSGGDFDGDIGLSGVLTGITVTNGNTFIVDETLLDGLQFGGPAIEGWALRDTVAKTYTVITNADPLEVSSGDSFSIVMIVDPSTAGGTWNLNKLKDGSKTGSETWNYNTSNQNRGTLTATGVQGAVPEPGTWMLMLLGFGVAGLAVRRRRVGVAQVA